MRKTGKALGKHVINLYFTSISRLLETKDFKKLRQDIEDDLIIKDQMTGPRLSFSVYVW